MMSPVPLGWLVGGLVLIGLWLAIGLCLSLRLFWVVTTVTFLVFVTFGPITQLAIGSNLGCQD